MKHGFYTRLAWTGIEKNRKTYLPYLFTCTGMVMMFYLIRFLSVNPSIGLMRGGDTLQGILGFGSYVMGIFSLIFLFYTNSFLIRRRKTEFGLYNILGMGKANLTRILLWETAIISGISILAGLLFGILFSKLAELIFVNLMNGNVTFTFSVQPAAVAATLAVFAGIFLLIFLNTLRQIHVSKPIELLHSDTVGERPPKANWIFAVLGAVMLAVAYGLAITIEDPISAILMFFVAVVLVIIATYLLFVAGSVALCRLLQKNKRYYYQTRHFISVSSMLYRMKRNGAGLASICILCTMVLVMLSSTFCLFTGTEDSLRARYPRDITIETATLDKAQTALAHQAAQQAVESHRMAEENLLQYQCLSVTGFLQENRISLNRELMDSAGANSTGALRQVFILSLQEYNRLSHSNETLSPGEALLYATKSAYSEPTLALEGTGEKKIQKTVPKFLDNGTDSAQIYPSIFLIVSDFEKERALLSDYLRKNYGETMSAESDFYGFDLPVDESEEIAIRKDISERIRKLQQANPGLSMVTVSSIADERADFYSLNAALLFLGALLGIVFLFAAVLIMYYKQISEGYEDVGRFEIMQKVGMTRREIKKSINSQVLTVFFLPLLAAGVHVIFAFPMISKMLMLFGLFNMQLLALLTLVCYLIFVLFYVLVYFVTSRSYYDIVSGTN